MHYRVYQDPAGQWRWRFVAANNKIVASGEGYYNKQDCLDAVALLKSSANAPIYAG